MTRTASFAAAMLAAWAAGAAADGISEPRHELMGCLVGRPYSEQVIRSTRDTVRAALSARTGSDEPAVMNKEQAILIGQGAETLLDFWLEDAETRCAGEYRALRSVLSKLGADVRPSVSEAINGDYPEFAILIMSIIWVENAERNPDRVEVGATLKTFEKDWRDIWLGRGNP